MKTEVWRKQRTGHSLFFVISFLLIPTLLFGETKAFDEFNGNDWVGWKYPIKTAFVLGYLNGMNAIEVGAYNLGLLSIDDVERLRAASRSKETVDEIIKGIDGFYSRKGIRLSYPIKIVAIFYDELKEINPLPSWEGMLELIPEWGY